MQLSDMARVQETGVQKVFIPFLVLIAAAVEQKRA
jgi:hypothetical protein